MKAQAMIEVTNLIRVRNLITKMIEGKPIKKLGRPKKTVKKAVKPIKKK